MDNIVVIKNKEYNLEKVWKPSVSSKKVDVNNKSFPFPSQGTEWGDKIQFINKLLYVEEILNRLSKWTRYKTPNNCLLCGKQGVSTKRYIYKNVIWEDGLSHYISVHNIEPSSAFKTFIYGNKIDQRLINRLNRGLKGTKIKKDNNIYIKIEKNQLLILDALMTHGGYNEKYFYDTENNFKFSEHAGMLDFEGDKLMKIIIMCDTQRIDDDDSDIYLPGDNLFEMKNYEYIFHTHPPTPIPGGRVNGGILYEFPSFGDICHFVENHNAGNVIGSLVVASEGLYNIRCIDPKIKRINLDEDALYNAFLNVFDDVQTRAIKKHGKNFTSNYFFEHIAQDYSFIKDFNKLLNGYKLHIDFYARKKNTKNNWILDDIFLLYRLS